MNRSARRKSRSLTVTLVAVASAAAISFGVAERRAQAHSMA